MLFSDSFFLQIILLYILCNFFFLDHAFYYLSYFFFLLMWLGFSLCYLELDTFAAVLWIVELSVIIVFFLFSFFINNMFSFKKYNIKLRAYTFFFLLPSIFISILIFSSKYYGYTSVNFFFTVNWVNYFKLLNSNLDNDFSLLFYLFLNLNAIEFLFIANLISLGCVLAVLFFLLIKQFKAYTDYFQFKSFKIKKKKHKFTYLRHQCFYKQQYRVPSIRICKKKF